MQAPVPYSCVCAITCTSGAPLTRLLQNDLSDAIFYLRVVLALGIGLFYGVIGAQGLMSFLS